MNLQTTKYRFIRYFFTLALFVSLACSSDDNTIEDEEELSVGTFTMKIDGELWTADEAYVSSVGGEEVWGEEDEEVYYVWITANKDLVGSNGEEDFESMVIGMALDPSSFFSPNGNYSFPPPDVEAALGTVGYAAAAFNRVSTAYAATPDLYNSSSNLGTLRITGFEIGQYLIYSDAYTQLSGTFELSMMNAYEFGSIEITEGRFNVRAPSFLNMPSFE